MAEEVRFGRLAYRTVVVHTVSYFAMGLIASSVMDYGRLFSQPVMSSLMRALDDPMVMAGPLLQPVRGLVFAVVFYLLRGCIFGKKSGWLVLWATLVGLGILSSFGPTPGSIEGLIYTRIAPLDQLVGLPEVIIQSLLLALGVTYWTEHPDRKWFGRAATAAFVVCMALPLLGLLAT